MIAELEKGDEEFNWEKNKYSFIHFRNVVLKMDKEYDEMAKDQKIANYKRISEALQELFDPVTPLNYKKMHHERLIEIYNRQKYFDLWYTEQAAKSINSKKTSTKITVTIDWTPFQDIWNRVQKAVTGTLETIKERIGKKKDKELTHITFILIF
ncbi:hypothetical protein B9Z55_011564 [Caenorhabditis nigoni]|nr:hypothetical protein B9Z55_011564 [Caenorhabditis nigoni]